MSSPYNIAPRKFSPGLLDRQIISRRQNKMLNAAQAHELFLARLAPGKSSQDALAWIERM